MKKSYRVDRWNQRAMDCYAGWIWDCGSNPLHPSLLCGLHPSFYSLAGCPGTWPKKLTRHLSLDGFRTRCHWEKTSRCWRLRDVRPHCPLTKSPHLRRFFFILDLAQVKKLLSDGCSWVAPNTVSSVKQNNRHKLLLKVVTTGTGHGTKLTQCNIARDQCIGVY